MNFFLEILLNSFSSVLSYNQFDLEPIFTEKKALQKRVRHESTMVKQGIYFFIMTILYLGLDYFLNKNVYKGSKLFSG